MQKSLRGALKKLFPLLRANGGGNIPSLLHWGMFPQVHGQQHMKTGINFDVDPFLITNI
jgi:hypothetical protein